MFADTHRHPTYAEHETQNRRWNPSAQRHPETSSRIAGCRTASRYSITSNGKATARHGLGELHRPGSLDRRHRGSDRTKHYLTLSGSTPWHERSLIYHPPLVLPTLSLPKYHVQAIRNININMFASIIIKQQIRTLGASDQCILNVLTHTLRELSVPEQQHALAFTNIQIPICHDQNRVQVIANAQLTMADSCLERG